MDYLDRRYQKNPSIVSRAIDEETILVPIRQNVGDLESIYTLNEVGARIWELIDGNRQLKEIRDVIVAEYKVTKAQATADIIDFVKQLESIGAISESTSDSVKTTID
jgi:hypothetical protein